jgi:hypothetical protein
MGSPIALPEIYKAAFEDFIIPSYEVAPFTTITNRALVTRSLKAIAGVERIMTKSVNLLQNEFGSNGQTVFELDTKDSRVRFVGDWRSTSTTNGSKILSSTTFNITDFVEVTFYGTGLNMLTLYDGTVQNTMYSVDGGADVSNIHPATNSAILSARNYNPNQVVSVVSGLTLGWHTVKLRNNSATVDTHVSGFEILNQRTDLAVYSGAGVSNGSVQGLSTLANNAFSAGVSGTRGARVVKYIQGGVLSQVVQEVDATSKYLTLADHTNEEVLRRINFREFGCNRADDFSTLAAVNGDRTSLLDDGTTVLRGNNVTVNSATNGVAINTNASNSNLTIVFVGTGLDIIWTPDTTGTNAVNSHEVIIDGVTVGGWDTTGTTQVFLTKKIASGLPYGTHVIKVLRNSPAVFSLNITDFIIYQPKKPSIPTGALECADYNVVANFVAPAANIGTNYDIIPQGVIKRMNSREYTYVNGTGGTVDWNISISVGVGALYQGWQIYTNRTGYYELPIWGTGFNYKFFTATTGSTDCKVILNGSLLTTANFPTASVSVVGGSGTFSLATGVFNTVNASTVHGNSLVVTGLPLGRYTVRFHQQTAGANTQIYGSEFEVITPIHINEPSLKIGSQSLKSVTKFSPEKSVSNAGPDLSKAKAWVSFDGTNQKILGQSNISAILKISAGTYTVFFEKPFKSSSYSGVGSCNENTSRLVAVTSKRTGSVNLVASISTTAVAEDNIVSAVFFGELIDE